MSKCNTNVTIINRLCVSDLRVYLFMSFQPFNEYILMKQEKFCKHYYFMSKCHVKQIAGVIAIILIQQSTSQYILKLKTISKYLFSVPIKIRSQCYTLLHWDEYEHLQEERGT